MNDTNTKEPGTRPHDAARTASPQGAARTASPHYTAANVILLNVRHERVYDGETDVLLRRERCNAAAWAMGEVVRFAGLEPDWCVDRWRAEEARLVSALAFEDAAKADAFRLALDEYARQMAAAGKDNELVVREDAALVAEVAAHFDAEWRRIHAEEMVRFRKILAETRADGAFARRIVLLRAKPAADDADGALLAKRVSDAANAAVNGAEALPYMMRLTPEGELVGAFGLGSKFDAKRLKAAFLDAGCGATTLDAADPDALPDDGVVFACHVLGKLKGAAKAAAEG